MTIEQKTNFIKLTPEEGYHISKADRSDMYEGFIYLGKYDLPENYIEVIDEEYEAWKRLKEEELKRLQEEELKRLQEEEEAKQLQEEEEIASLTNLE